MTKQKFQGLFFTVSETEMEGCVKKWPEKVLNAAGMVVMLGALQFNKSYNQLFKKYVSRFRDDKFKSDGLRFSDKKWNIRFFCKPCGKGFIWSASKESCQAGQAVTWSLNHTECTCFGNVFGYVDVEAIEEEHELVYDAIEEDLVEIPIQGSQTPRTHVVKSLSIENSSPKASTQNLQATTPKSFAPKPNIMTPKTPIPLLMPKRRMCLSDSKTQLMSQRTFNFESKNSPNSSNRWPEAARNNGLVHSKTKLQSGMEKFLDCFENSGADEDVGVDGMDIAMTYLKNRTSAIQGNPTISPTKVGDLFKVSLSRLIATKVYKQNSSIDKENSEILKELFVDGNVKRNLSVELDSSVPAGEEDKTDSKSSQKEKKKKRDKRGRGDSSDDDRKPKKKVNKDKRHQKEPST